MAEQSNHHHHHHHHKKDSATLFKERSLRAIARNQLIERCLKIGLVIVALIMGCLVVAAYMFG